MPTVEEQLQVEQKHQYVRGMFNNISPRYDFLNHFLSAGADRYWRRRAIKMSGLEKDSLFLDVACGTGDLSMEASKRNPAGIVAVDFSENMLRRFQTKCASSSSNGRTRMIQANAEMLPFADNVFDVIGVAFGVRNFGDLERGLSEMRRVLKVGGNVVILEFSKPKRFPVKQIYFYYFQKILPTIGKLVSGDGGAYNYLPRSVSSFPDGVDFEKLMLGVKFTRVESVSLTFGIATAYLGSK